MSSEEVGVKTRAQNAPLHPGLSNNVTKVTESEGKEKGTSTEPNSRPEDEVNEVTVRHGSSAHGLEQDTDKLEDKHVEKEKSGDATPKANPTEPNDMDIVDEQEENKNKDEDKDEENQEENPQVTRIMTTMLSHMTMLGAQLDNLTKKMREMEDRERLRGRDRTDSPSTSLVSTPPKSEQQIRRARSDSTRRTSHNTNLALDARSNFVKAKYPSTPYVSQSREYSAEIEGQEIRSRRTSLSEIKSQSDERRSASRRREESRNRRRKIREYSTQRSVPRRTSHDSDEENSVASVDSERLMHILETFAETQLASKTRARDNDEKALSALTKHKLLADRTEGKEIQWLLNLNMLREQRDWTDKRYCTFLPRLWNPQAKPSITRFFLNLNSTVSKSRISLDKVFIEEYATGGIAKLLKTSTHASQPEDSTCKEFLEDVQFATKALNKWYPDAVPNESYIIETLSQRFTSAEMLKRLAYARKGKKKLNLLELEEMAILADEHDRIERRAGTNRILRIQMREDNVGHALDYSVSSSTSIRSIIDDTRSCVVDQNECMEEMLLSMAATETIHQHEGIPTIRAVSRIMDRMKRAPPIATMNVNDVKMRGAVCNGPLKHLCHKNHICIWHSLKGVCNMPEGKCRHPHVSRKAEICKLDKSGSCTHGGYCQFRHSSDQYEVLFYDRRSRKYNKYIWNDRISPFSIYYKNK